MMKLAVIGGGALGLLLAGRFHLAGHNVVLVAREPTVSQVNREGAWVQGLTKVTARIHTDTGPPAYVDWLVLAVKSYHLDDVLPILATHTAPVLACQNGLTTVPRLATELGTDRVAAMITGMGATLLGPGHTRHTGRGYTVLGEAAGEITPRLEALGEAFGSAGIAADLTDNLDGELWLKALVNAAINPVTAVTGVLNGALADGPLHDRARAACEEGAAVARALGIMLPADPWERTQIVIENTAENRSSMQQDIEHGRPTEIDDITGEIVRRGRAAGVATPVNIELWEAVMGLEEGR